MDIIIESANCIAKAFENHKVFIFNEEINNKQQYYFRASDVGDIIGIVNIRSSTQNFTEKERCVHEVDTKSGKKEVIFLTSRGVYRLIYASKKEIAEKFRDWVGDILDDIIFNDSQELKNKIKQLEYKHKLELDKKETEKNWLHNVTRNQVTFKKYVTKTDGVYLGAAAFEHQNYIEKIGKSIEVRKREDKLATANSGTNAFQVYKNYETYSGLEQPTEKYVHALLAPLHVNTERGGTEHFMIHRTFADSIIEKVIVDQNNTITLINNYIDLLQINQYNYSNMSKILDNVTDCTSAIELSKICIGCNANLNMDMFTVLDKKNNVYNEKCNICISDQTQIALQLVENTLTGKKKCTGCDETYNLDMFFIDIDNKNLLIAECRNCVNIKENCSVKQCNVCFVIQTYNNFRKNTKFKDNHTAKCNACHDSEKVICEFCRVQVIPDNLLNHQRTASCIEAQQTITNTVPLKVFVPVSAELEVQTEVKIPIEPGIKKQCNTCEKVFPISNFYYSPSKKLYDGKCRACLTSYKLAARTRLKENPTYNIKECDTCHEVKKLMYYFKTENNTTCKVCYNKQHDPLNPCKQCNRCLQIKALDNFTTDNNAVDGKTTICKACKDTTERTHVNDNSRATCNLCGTEGSKRHMSAHQRSKKCIQIQSVLNTKN